MAVITLTIPDAVLPRVIVPLSVGWNVNLPVTRAQFAKQSLIEFIMDAVIRYEAQIAAKTAGDAAIIQTNSDIVIT